MTTKTADQLYDILYDAQALLFNAIELLETYVRETDDREAEAYVIDHLKIIAGRDHGFLASDLNIDDLMERLDDRDEDDDENDDADEDTAAPPLHDTTGRPFLWSSQLHCYVAIPDND